MNTVVDNTLNINDFDWISILQRGTMLRKELTTYFVVSHGNTAF